MTQTQTINQSKRIQKRMERLYLAKVYKALQAQIKAFTNDLRLGGVDYAKGRLSMDIMNGHIGPVIKSIYRMSALSNANQVYSRLKKYEVSLKYRTFGFNEVWTQDVLNYFRLHLLEKAVLPISETTKEIILRTLEKATTEGWSISETVKYLETTDITKNRARTIVRTETVRATNFGGMLGAFESTLVMEKEWIDSNDFRVRVTHTHAGVGGEKRDLLKPFSNGLQFPGDPEGSAKETVNCRCVLGFTPKRDKNGRLIKKPVSGIRSSIVDVLAGALLGFELGQLINDN